MSRLQKEFADTRRELDRLRSRVTLGAFAITLGLAAVAGAVFAGLSAIRQTLAANPGLPAPTITNVVALSLPTPPGHPPAHPAAPPSAPHPEGAPVIVEGAPSGAPLSAEAATQLALQIARGKLKSEYGIEPILDDKVKAVRHDGRWSWQRRVDSAGKSLRLEVTFDPDGANAAIAMKDPDTGEFTELPRKTIEIYRGSKKDTATVPR